MASIHLGTIGWSYNFWKGKFYPSKVASKEFLAYYATKFDTVEVDSRFTVSQLRKPLQNGKAKRLAVSCFHLSFLE